MGCFVSSTDRSLRGRVSFPAGCFPPAIAPLFRVRARAHPGTLGWPLAWALLLAAGCGSDTDSGWIDPKSIPRWSVEEEVRLGLAEGDEAELFGSIGAATVTTDGELWLFDSRPAQIRRFDLQGNPRGVVGRPGEGPGEFSRVRGMLARRSGEVVVLDVGTARLTRFSSQGALMGTQPLPPAVTGGGLHEDLEGHLYLRARDLSDPNRVPGSGPPPYEWLRVDEHLEVVARIPAPPPDEESGGGMVFATPLGPVVPNLTRTLHVLGAGGEVIRAHNRSYVLVREAADGSLADTLARVAARPAMKTAAERRELEERIGQDPRVAAPPSLDPEKPILESLSVDLDGRIWARLRVEAQEVEGLSGFRWHEPGVWDVWSPGGEPLGRIEIPPGHVWLNAHGDRFWVRTFGPLGEPQVVQFRIHEGGQATQPSSASQQHDAPISNPEL